jgi:hypothetical protein
LKISDRLDRVRSCRESFDEFALLDEGSLCDGDAIEINKLGAGNDDNQISGERPPIRQPPDQKDRYVQEQEKDDANAESRIDKILERRKRQEEDAN